MEDVRKGILNCAERYKELLEKQVSYEIEFFSKKAEEIQKIAIFFNESEFKHLIGLGKIETKTDSSEVLYKKLNGIFSVRKNEKGEEIYISPQSTAKKIIRILNDDNFFYDDLTRKAELNEEKYAVESKQEKNLHHYFRSDMVDRMSALEHFYDTMNRMQLDGTSVVSLKMYRWLRNDGTSTIQEKRPRGSTIDADYLFEFEESGTLPEKPYVDFFVKKSDTSGKNPNVSIFKSEETYSDDTAEFKAGHPRLKSRALEDDIIVLSVTRTMLENGKEVSETKTADKSVIADCQKRIEERIEKEKQSELDREARRNPHEAEKTIATGVLRNLKATRCRDKESKKTEYRKELCHLYEKTDYTLHEIKAVLENSCNSKNNEKYREQMEKEIRLVDSILKTRETIDKITVVEQATTDDNFFEQADKYIELQNKIKSEINCSDMKDVLCHNIAEMLTQHEISNADESIKSTLSMEYMSGFIKYVSDLAEEKSGSVVMRTDFKKPAEFRNINPDGTSTLDIFSSLKQSLYEAGQQIKEYAEKIKDFMKEKAKSFLNLFRKNNADDKPDDTASPTGQGSNSDNGASEREPETEQEESQEQMQENSRKFCYCMEYQIETYDFCQYEENNYSEIIESPKASAGIKAEISNEKWESMIPQRDIIQPNQEYQHSDRSDNQEQEEEYHEKENDSLDR